MLLTGGWRAGSWRMAGSKKKNPQICGVLALFTQLCFSHSCWDNGETGKENADQILIFTNTQDHEFVRVFPAFFT